MYKNTIRINLIFTKYFVIKTILIKIIYLKHYTNLSKVYDKNEKQ